MMTLDDLAQELRSEGGLLAATVTATQRAASSR